MKNIITGFIIFILSMIPIMQDGTFYSDTLEVLNCIIVTICILMLLSSQKENYSLYKILALFVMFFFCIAPITQYKTGTYFWGTKFTEDDYIMTSSYVLFALVLYLSCYKIFKKNIIINNIKQVRNIQIPPKKETTLIFISFFICIYYLYINNFNIFSLLFRGGEFVDRIERNQSIGQIIETFIRPMPMIIFLSVFLAEKRRKMTLYILFLLMIITAPPTGMPRFSAAAIYIPVVICTIPFLRKGQSFIFLVIFGLLLVLPFLDLFRNFSSDNTLKIGINFDQFTELHFDSFSMFMRALGENFITNGRQLLGALFFFVPRAIWPDKPSGSGHTMFENMNMDFTNVSMPYFAEGYINFGIIGIVIFTVFIAYLTAKLDKDYWCSQKNSKIININTIAYTMQISLLMMILRGDLMSSFSFTCGFMASFYTIRWYITKD